VAIPLGDPRIHPSEIGAWKADRVASIVTVAPAALVAAFRAWPSEGGPRRTQDAYGTRATLAQKGVDGPIRLWGLQDQLDLFE
jgi:hypothetical protein